MSSDVGCPVIEPDEMETAFAMHGMWVEEQKMLRKKEAIRRWKRQHPIIAYYTFLLYKWNKKKKDKQSLKELKKIMKKEFSEVDPF